MGRTRPRSETERPFKLDLERLLQTGGNMGDVLARLIDAAGEAAPTSSGSHSLQPNWWQINPMAPRQFPRAAWRQLIKAQPPGVWSREMCGPAPGTDGCLVPPDLIRELQLSSTGASS